MRSNAPSALRACTSNVCGPSMRSRATNGEVQGRNSSPSTEQRNVEPGWSEENANVAVEPATGEAGGASSEVTGAVVTAQV